MKVLRTAIIGCGGIARRHAGVLSKLGEVELVGFCDSAPERAEGFNTTYAGGRARVFHDHHALFETLDLDMVFICLPPFAHSDEVELACSHGIHFLIEKPIALTMGLAEAMAGYVARSGVKSQVGFMFRHGEAVQWLRDYIRQHDVADRGFVIGQYYCNSLHSPWWRDRARSGGQLVEQIIHTVDLARLFLGEPARVYSIQENLFHRQIDDYTVEDASATVVRFQAGGLGVLVGSNGAIPGKWDSRVRVILPELTADLEGPNNGTFRSTSGEPSTVTIAAERDVFLAQALDLIGAIRDDRPTSVPIEEGVRSLRLALAATESAQGDVPVDVPAPAPGT